MEARLDAMRDSLYRSLQARLDQVLVKEVVSFAREIDRSLLDRTLEIYVGRENTIRLEIPGKISKGAEDILCRLYKSTGWLIHFYNGYDPRNTKNNRVVVRGFDISDEVQFLKDQES
jgi:hypothetical protein